MLLCFISCINPRTSKKLLDGTNCEHENFYPNVFRKAASYYYRKKIQPYLTLPGLVEMDETYLGNTKFNATNK